MVYAGTSWEGPKWSTRVAPQAIILDRLKALPRAVVVAMAAVLVALSVGIAAPAVQAHVFRVSCSALAYRPADWYGFPYARGGHACDASGYRHFTETTLYLEYRFARDSAVDWTNISTTKRYQSIDTSGAFWEDRGCYYSYTTVSGHGAQSSSCAWY